MGRYVRHAHEEQHEETTLLEPIGKPTGANTEKAGHHIWRDSQKLTLLGGEGADAVDDGGHEKRVRVQASVNANGDEHMDPDLPVLEGSLEVLDVELIGKGRTIELETVGDLLTLRRLEKLGGLRVVVHGEVGDDG